ncbi:MAG TPA: serine hydrolase domain-containing protein [Polyangia bacterium]|nr:serine hydrolase domain-containing protein [Polyangia bacterium]
MTRAFEPVRRLCAEAVSAGVVPGAVVLASADGQTAFHEAFGQRQLIPDSWPATLDTLYDVASVSKAVVTSVLAMQAVGSGAFRLDDAVANHLPEFVGEGKPAVTVRHLLSHASGLPAHRPFYERVVPGADRRLGILRAAAAEPLIAPPGARSVYTDLGFILLGWLLERLGGARLDQQARRSIFEPLGLTATTFTPEVGAAPIAATEVCAVRERTVVGEVHDLNAFALEGVAGHAGLFSTAGELAAVARALRAAWHGDAGASLVERDVIREFWRPAGVPESNWRLGWDGPAAHNSQAGARISRAAVGHLGFTGCSLWIDPASDRFVVLLSNRVHPAVRDDPRFRAFRPAVHDAIFDALA